MTIGDDIFTILGMMPIRDRAGIQRATMADEAVKASGGNAEGQALTRQGQAPPNFQLPPTMGGQQADVTLPDNVPTEYASGRGGGKPSALPVPQERVVAASPAAAPSPEMRSGSDMILAEMAKRKRAEDMNGLFASIGLLANGLRRGGGGDDSSRNALIEQAFGGGHKAATISEMIALQNLHTQEGEKAAALAARERAIQHNMITNKWDREHATYMVDSGNAAKFSDPDQLIKRQGIVDTENRKKQLRELAPEIAKARGTDVRVINAMIEKDPDEVAKLAEAGGLIKLESERQDATKKTIDNTKALADLQSAYWFQKDPQGFIKAHPDLDANELAEIAQMGPTARLKFQESRAGKLGELDDTQKQRVTFHDKNYAEKVRPAQEQNAGTLREMQNLWSPDLKSGTKYSQFMLDSAKMWAKATSAKEIPQNLQQAEQFFNYQKNDILAGLKQTGSNPTDADRDYSAAAAGDITNSPRTIRNLLYLKEKQNNIRIAQHNDEVTQSGGKVAGRAMMGKFQEPNKIMREVAEEHHPGYIAMLVREGKADDPKAKAYFENDPAKGMGPGVYDFLVAAEKARQKKDAKP